MPAERRSLRSNKPESSSTNGEKGRSNSQTSSSNKDKPAPTRASSAKGKALPAKKGSVNSVAKDMSGDKPHTNGTDPVENGVNGTDDTEMKDDSNSTDKLKPAKDKDGDEEMTVVVPPPKSSKLIEEAGKDEEGDVVMEGVEKSDDTKLEETIDPAAKAVLGSYFPSKSHSCAGFVWELYSGYVLTKSIQTSRRISLCLNVL